MTTALPPAKAAQISFVAVLAVADLVDRCLPVPITRLKWPNDALVQGRKVSGILVESGARPDGQLWLAVGIGINLQTPPQNPERPAAAIGDFLGATVPSQAEAMDVLNQTFDHWLMTWQQGGFEPIAKAWTARAYGLGLACTARLGHETVEGVAEGLGSDGALSLRLADGSIRCISAGDVFLGDA
jgi:BirA family biotin operon repressor/biotin-[acetyl-CoA-carboxylase] ligase